MVGWKIRASLRRLLQGRNLGRTICRGCPREYYQGDAVIHWTQTTFDRSKGSLNERFHVRFRELMLHAAVREGLFCPVYCLMPDHIHLVWIGLNLTTDQLRAMSFLRTYLEPELAPCKFQHQPEDNVLREKERKQSAFAKVCFYVLNNPVRAELASEPGKWAYCGGIIPGYPSLHPLEEDFWPKFWKIYEAHRHPDAGKIKRTPVCLCLVSRLVKAHLLERRRN
jgi:hypothetical protein